MASAVLPTVRIFGEEPTGAVDGVNTVFDTAYTFIAGTQVVSLNGVCQVFGPTCQYDISESTPGQGYDRLTFAEPPRNGDQLKIDYTRC